MAGQIAPSDTISVETDICDIPSKVCGPVAALRTNVLLPFLNIGAELPLGNRWSLEADYYYPWIKRESDHKDCFQVLYWTLGGRYWFGDRHLPGTEHVSDRLRGHSLGVNALGGYYDIGFNYSGYQGTLYGAGVKYLYARPIAKGRLRMEFSFGLSYIHADAQAYRVRYAGGKLLRKRDTKNRFDYVGPSSLGLSLVIPINGTVRGR